MRRLWSDLGPIKIQEPTKYDFLWFPEYMNFDLVRDNEVSLTRIEFCQYSLLILCYFQRTENLSFNCWFFSQVEEDCCQISSWFAALAKVSPTDCSHLEPSKEELEKILILCVELPIRCFTDLDLLEFLLPAFMQYVAFAAVLSWIKEVEGF